jgi:hypothetical protein
MNITTIDVESPHSVSWEADEFGVILHGVSKNGVDCTHELTDWQLEGIRHQIETQLESEKASHDLERALSAPGIDWLTGRRTA